MSNITITQQQSGPKYLATEVGMTGRYESEDGIHWKWKYNQNVSVSDQYQDTLRQALIRHLDTTAEPQRAKVGDLVRVEYDHPFVERGSVWKIVKVGDSGTPYAYRKGSETLFWGFSGDYIIVPEPVPAPAPKTYTGNPKDWEEGVYASTAKDIAVVVRRNGRWLGIDDTDYIYSQDYSFVSDFHRISTDPASAVRKCFDAISGKGGE